MSVRLLDVTLRDGGYVNDHNFSDNEAYSIVNGLGKANIEYAELGYYRPSQIDSSGRFRQGPAVSDPEYLAGFMDAGTSPKLVVMVHLDRVTLKEYKMLSDLNISLVRVIVKPENPENFDVVRKHIEAIKDLGMLCSVNLIRVSEIPLYSIVYYGKKSEAFGADFFYIADSNGSLFPSQVYATVRELSENLSIQIGFHAHDGLSLAFANSVAAIDAGVHILDSTLGGMGKGGGNLRTELIATYLNWCKGSTYNLSQLAQITQEYINKWLTFNSINKCTNVLSSIMNLNIDKIQAIEETAKEANLPSLNLMEKLLTNEVEAVNSSMEVSLSKTICGLKLL
jgi:4-hydroxy 2-oxovalerate aldolase